MAKRSVGVYERAKKDPKSWPGCGKSGQCRPCGRLHDFQTVQGGHVYHNVRCWTNWMRGCPDPQLAPKHDLNRRHRCRVCGCYDYTSEDGGGEV